MFYTLSFLKILLTFPKLIITLKFLLWILDEEIQQRNYDRALCMHSAHTLPANQIARNVTCKF